MRIVALVRDNHSLTNDRVRALAAGFDSLGHTVLIRTRSETIPVAGADLVIQAGFQLCPGLEEAMNRGKPFIVLENATWDKAPEVASWRYNGLMGGGWLPPAPSAERPKPALRPWKHPGEGRVTIFGQMENDRSLRGVDMAKWLEEAHRAYPKATVRPHPNMLNSWDDAKKNMESFSDCLDRTSLAVTWTSTTGAETVIAGIPTIACHHGSSAWPVTAHRLGATPVTPDREAWLHHMSWGQGTLADYADPKFVSFIADAFEEAEERALDGEYDDPGTMPDRYR